MKIAISQIKERHPTFVTHDCGILSPNGLRREGFLDGEYQQMVDFIAIRAMGG